MDEIAALYYFSVFRIFYQQEFMMLTLTSSEAQNTFGTVIDKSQREIVSVTRRGRVATLIMSPEVLEDYVDARLAMQAAEQG
jgi:uroporphyrinogen-III synthase